jgi:hypothetical protein
MKREKLEERLQELQEEHQKGLALIEDTRVKVLRIEGAMIQIKEFLKGTSAE